MFINKYVVMKTSEGEIKVDVGMMITIFSHKIQHGKYDHYKKSPSVILQKLSPQRKEYGAPFNQPKITAKESNTQKPITIKHKSKIRTMKTVIKNTL